MVSRTTVTAAVLALGIGLAGCTAPSGSTAESSPTPSQTASTATAESTGTPTGSAGPEEVQLPDYMAPYPDASIVSSSRAQAESGDLEQVSLVMKAQADPQDIIDYYTERLQGAGFETFGSGSTTNSAQVVNFRHTENDGMLVITISDDPDDEASSIVTVGGTVAP